MTLKFSGAFLLLVLLYSVHGAKILALFHVPSKSHHILGDVLLRELAARGHQVAMVSPFPSKKTVKNYEDIYVEEMLAFKEDGFKKIMALEKNGTIITRTRAIGQQLLRINELLINSTSVQNLLKSKRKFDLVIQTWVANEVLLGLSHHFGAKTIAFSTVGSNVMTNILTGTPSATSYVPDLFLGYSENMNFYQRFLNTLTTKFSEVMYLFFVRPQQEELRQIYFPNTPTVDEMVANVSLVLLNSHFSLESPKPSVPGMIHIGGFHVSEPKELNADLKEFMDSATNGVIFFSLGSNFKSSDLEPHELTEILNTFRKLPLKVLWKFEKDDIPDLPKNVKIGKWLPQTDILAHSNTKLFITHGGLLSTTEAVYRGVPMIVIPLFGDQRANAASSVNKGYAVQISPEELSENVLTNAINEILNNPSYRENIKQRSSWLKDQPIKQLDNAIFWIEYVLRHKGAHHLRISGLKLSWYQFYLMDVYAVTGIIVIATFFIMFKILSLLIRLLKKLICRKKNVNGEKSKTD